MSFLIIVGLIPGRPDLDLQQETTLHKTYPIIESIDFQYEEDNVNLKVELDTVEVTSENKGYLNIYSFGFDSGSEKEIKKEYSILIANKATFSMQMPNEKTLYELEYYCELYPSRTTTRDFILYPNETIENDLPSKSINPIKIDFKNNHIDYDDFVLKNYQEDIYFKFRENNLPYFQDDSLNGKVHIYLDIPIDSEKDYLEGTIEKGKINIEKIYYDYKQGKISFNEEDTLVENLNFPIKKFKVRLEMFDLGISKSKIVTEHNFYQDENYFGDCEVSFFCFQG